MKKIAKYISNLIKIREQKKVLEDKIKKLDVKTDELEELIIGEMLNVGVQSINLAGIGTTFLSKSEYPSIENQDVFYKYLRGHGQGDIIKETVHSSTLRGWWNGLEGEAKPDAAEVGLGVYTKTKVSIRKG